MFPETIPGKIVTLKILDQKYFENYHNMFSPKIRKALGLPEVATLDQTEDFLSKKIEDLKIGATIFYCIFDNKTKQLIGSIEIREPGFVDGQLGAWINEHFWGGGRYQEALDLMLQEYFRQKKVDSINAFIESTNIRSFKAHQKYGFTFIREFSKDDKTWCELIFKTNLEK